MAENYKLANISDDDSNKTDKTQNILYKKKKHKRSERRQHRKKRDGKIEKDDDMTQYSILLSKTQESSPLSPISSEFYISTKHREDMTQTLTRLPSPIQIEEKNLTRYQLLPRETYASSFFSVSFF